jgi:hypothetical protein
VTGRKSVHEDSLVLSVNGYITNNQQIIFNSCNDHFLSTTNRVNSKTSNNSYPDRINSILTEYLLQTCKNPFPNIKYNYRSKKEIENIMKSVKPTNSHGYDEIFVKILKACSHFIRSP